MDYPNKDKHDVGYIRVSDISYEILIKELVVNITWLCQNL